MKSESVKSLRRNQRKVVKYKNSEKEREKITQKSKNRQKRIKENKLAFAEEH